MSDRSPHEAECHSLDRATELYTKRAAAGSGVRRSAGWFRGGSRRSASSGGKSLAVWTNRTIDRGDVSSR